MDEKTLLRFPIRYVSETRKSDGALAAQLRT